MEFLDVLDRNCANTTCFALNYASFRRDFSTSRFSTLFGDLNDLKGSEESYLRERPGERVFWV